jgi:hypothetical protein
MRPHLGNHNLLVLIVEHLCVMLHLHVLVWLHLNELRLVLNLLETLIWWIAKLLAWALIPFLLNDHAVSRINYLLILTRQDLIYRELRLLLHMTSIVQMLVLNCLHLLHGGHVVKSYLRNLLLLDLHLLVWLTLIEDRLAYLLSILLLIFTCFLFSRVDGVHGYFFVITLE